MDLTGERNRKGTCVLAAVCFIDKQAKYGSHPQSIFSFLSVSGDS
jgi:hypothetical protein